MYEIAVEFLWYIITNKANPINKLNDCLNHLDFLSFLISHPTYKPLPFIAISFLLDRHLTVNLVQFLSLQIQLGLLLHHCLSMSTISVNEIDLLANLSDVLNFLQSFALLAVLLSDLIDILHHILSINIPSSIQKEEYVVLNNMFTFCITIPTFLIASVTQVIGQGRNWKEEKRGKRSEQITSPRLSQIL